MLQQFFGLCPMSLPCIKLPAFALWAFGQKEGGIGKINIDPKHESSKYTIIKLNDLKNVIIPHFEKYPLLTPLAYVRPA
jgi:hypothetical protein